MPKKPDLDVALRPSAPRPLKWHGGKHYLAKKIIELMPPHTHYVEPFFGGGAVLLSKPWELIEEHSELANDLDGDLTNFWQVLQDQNWFEDFKRRVEAVPFSEAEYCGVVGNRGDRDVVSRATAFFIRYRQSRQGLGKDFATMSRTRTRRGMNEQVSAWLSAVQGLPEAHHRLRRVAILNHDGLEVIEEQDGPDTLFYLDPPYLHDTRVTKKEFGELEMSDEEHKKLLYILNRIQGRFMLSGYPSRMYQTMAVKRNWNYVEWDIDCKASSSKHKPGRVEGLWFNF